VSGTPTSASPTAGNVRINATTGFASGSRDFSYNLIPDSIIFIVDPTTYQFQGGQAITGIDINAVAYSGTTVSNYDLSMNVTYGMTINPVNGVVGGVWSSGIPPDLLIPSSCNFSVTAEAGTLKRDMSGRLIANPGVSDAMLFVAYGNPFGEDALDSYLYATTPSESSTLYSLLTTFPSTGVGDMQFKNNEVNNNVVMLSVNTSSGGGVYRATRLDNFTFVDFPGSTSTSVTNEVSALAHIPGTSNWRAGGRRGSFDNNGEAVLFTSSNDGLSWDTSDVLFVKNDFGQAVKTRDDGSNFPENPYLNGGIALKYSSGYNVLMAGGLYNGLDGPAMVRSTDLGANWTDVNGGFAQECAYLNVDVSSMWIATGSDGYQTRTYAEGAPSSDPPSFPFTPTNTIKYSTDQGLNWSNAAGGFNMYGYELVYGNGTWVATGVTVNSSGEGNSIVPEMRFSTDGSNWSLADLSADNLFDPSNSNAIIAPLRMGSMNFDGENWNVLVIVETPGLDASTSVPVLYKHDASTSLANGWVAYELSELLQQYSPEINENTRFLTFSPPKLLYTGELPINITLSFIPSISGLGPTFTSPTTTSYLQYQYMQIPPIQISATGVGQIYYFVTAADLPPGLSFNPITAQITGAPVQIGTDSVTVYAKDDNGTSQIVIGFNTVIPRIIRKQDGAAAYTSLLRQYTEVVAAQSARDNRALPTEMRTLGEFMSPVPPPVVTPSNCPC
jgi:hypothetical protein